ncbi:MAG: flavodoxin [Firmicutes bacterium HGW-Firmicutes-14]|nr:MAG: flavodoxin [Firmicutes bacterium HGW-Firmicutes-14]
MKTLIVYDSTHGTVKECAGKLEGRLSGEVTAVKISNKKSWPVVDDFDNVIIGASIHAGKIQKSVGSFCRENLDKLTNKKVGIFLCTLTPADQAFHYIEEQFPPELVQHASEKSCFGGAVHFERMNFIERFIMKKITKSASNIYQVSEDAITHFASEF